MNALQRLTGKCAASLRRGENSNLCAALRVRLGAPPPARLREAIGLTSHLKIYGRSLLRSAAARVSGLLAGSAPEAGQSMATKARRLASSGVVAEWNQAPSRGMVVTYGQEPYCSAFAQRWHSASASAPSDILHWWQALPAPNRCKDYAGARQTSRPHSDRSRQHKQALKRVLAMECCADRRRCRNQSRAAQTSNPNGFAPRAKTAMNFGL
jgi:hypothetical protein